MALNFDTVDKLNKDKCPLEASNHCQDAKSFPCNCAGCITMDNYCLELSKEEESSESN